MFVTCTNQKRVILPSLEEYQMNYWLFMSYLLASCAKSSSSSSSSSAWTFVTAATGVEGIAFDLGRVSFNSAGLRLEEPISGCWGLKFVTRFGKGEPERIASCFASKLWRPSFNSRPRPRSSSSLPQNQKYILRNEHDMAPFKETNMHTCAKTHWFLECPKLWIVIRTKHV